MSQIKFKNNCEIQWKIHFLREFFSWAWNELSFKLTSLSLSLSLKLELQSSKTAKTELQAQRSSQLAYALHYLSHNTYQLSLMTYYLQLQYSIYSKREITYSFSNLIIKNSKIYIH